MKTWYLAAAAAIAFAPAAASAQTVYNTSLQNVNGVFGTSTATTTTDSAGTRTVVTGPGPNSGANRAQGTPVLNQWFQANVGAGSTVGITTDYARSGNGSAYFSQTQNDTGKADLQYYFGGAPIALSSLSSFSFDHYRDAASTNNAIQSMVLRLDILKDGVFAGALIYEPYYTTNGNEPVNTWTTSSGNLTTGNWWTNNSLLGPTNATAGGTKSLADWISGNAGSTLSVYGVEIGFGSGWQGNFFGAVDNVSVQFGNAGGLSSNFEVAATAGVPEPATWAMMIMGFGLMGYSMRRRRATLVIA
ncbi:MAG: PEP-CTERM sorting domain-containing protein [Proteobacteria bacterium]|nr:PEP-CTERM sorting domain-containing protein [Pseudomonadota bacterium]